MNSQFKDLDLPHLGGTFVLNTSPELWLKLQVKNELIEINREKMNNREYSKYDYENLLVAEP